MNVIVIEMNNEKQVFVKWAILVRLLIIPYLSSYLLMQTIKGDLHEDI